jgi:hypothetical protein
MRILCNILVVLFVTATAVGQQINPVPDYIFRNSMSVGRNAPTDTSAYFSIGPRFGATRGFMPPMVTDTASVTGTKRNGLLIYSIQRNSFLYWDSTGMRWSRIAANLDTLLLSTRAWRQKGDDSLAAIINTRMDTVNLLSTKAWRQKGIDSVASVRVGGSGTTNYVPKFTAASTIGNSSILDGANTVSINSTTQSSSYKLLVRGNILADSSAYWINTSNAANQLISFRNNLPSGATGRNVFIGNGGNNISGTGNNGSYLTAVGYNAMVGNTSGQQNDAFGAEALRENQTGIGNSAFGNFALAQTKSNYNTGIGIGAASSNVNGANNTAVGANSIGGIKTSNNTALGFEAGERTANGVTNDSATNSIYIGYQARPKLSETKNTNEIIIGYTGRGNGSNTTTIGNTSTVGTYIPAGESYFGTTTDAGDFRVQVNGNQYVSGNVGIGITPTQKLHVDGDAIINGHRVGRGAGNIATNLAVGSSALQSANSSSASNVSVGFNTSVSLTSGTNNTVVGGLAGQAITTHTNNVFVGRSAGSSTAGSNNTFIGASAGSNIVSGNDNIYIGYLTGTFMTSSSNNIIIGKFNGNDTLLDMRASNGNIVIGDPAFSNRIRIRIDSAGNTGIGQAVPTERLHVNGNILGTGNITTADPSGGTKKPWRLGEAATVSPTSPNRTIRVEIDGVVYYLHAKTTND